MILRGVVKVVWTVEVTIVEVERKRVSGLVQELENPLEIMDARVCNLD